MPVSSPAWLKRQPSSPPGPPPAEEAIEAFKAFVDAQSFPDALKWHAELLDQLDISPGPFQEFYPKFKSAIRDHLPFRYKEIFKILDARSKLKPYGGAPAEKQRVLVVGGGPMGFRTAIETQLLGARTLVIERREDFTRHNVVKLWKFLLADYKALGVKKFVGKFCSGSVNHIGIKDLQLFLAKVVLFLGIEVIAPLMLLDIVEPAGGKGWRAAFKPEGTRADGFEFDFIVIASGKKVAVEGFNRRSLDAKLAIAVTANFVNGNTSEESAVKEIAGISKQYHQDFFKGLKEEHDIDLENIVYYRGHTHYFVMTALRSSLIERGVILEDKDDRKALLHPGNIDKERLHQYAIDSAQYSTATFSSKLPVTEFALNARGDPDCAIFDFTNLYSASNASAVRVRNGCQLLMTIVGDSLLEPFWPEGTGCGRGVLSCLDAAWLFRQWCLARVNPLEILTERENVYKLLSQTTDGGGLLKDSYKSFTIKPDTRYKSIPKKIDHEKILSLYDTDAADEFEFLKEKFLKKQFYDRREHMTLLQKFRKGVANKNWRRMQVQMQMVNAFNKRTRRTTSKDQQQQQQQSAATAATEIDVTS